MKLRGGGWVLEIAFLRLVAAMLGRGRVIANDSKSLHNHGFVSISGQGQRKRKNNKRVCGHGAGMRWVALSLRGCEAWAYYDSLSESCKRD